MERTDREITDLAEIESILKNATVCRIGMADGGEPCIVPVCFGDSDGKIYLPSGTSGKKITLLEKNPRCCFEVDQCDGIIRCEQPCASEMQYQSVIGFGRVNIISDSTEKKHGLNCIMRHYGAGCAVFPMMTSEMSV